jgi:hypothetical protein
MANNFWTARFQLDTFMIQRIQTVYLLLITALTIALFFLPMAVIQADNTFYSFDVSGLTPINQTELDYSTWGLMVWAVIISLIAIVSVFLYKKRVLQIRLCVFNAILLIGFYGLFAFFVWNRFAWADIHFKVQFALSFPLISLILDYLAIRNIGADEMLVRSLDRLR